MLEEQYFHKSWTTCLCMNFVNAWIGTMAIITPAASPVWINFSAWPSHNLRTEKACGILKPVSVHVKRNFIISVFAAASLVAHLLMLMKNETGEYTPTSVKS